MAVRQPQGFGALLKRYRVAAGLTQQELAERAGVSERSVGDLERGLDRTPYRDTVQRLARALELASDEQDAFERVARGHRGTAPERCASIVRPGGGMAPAPPLIGRTKQVAVIERHLAGDGPPLVLLAGEPGIGKTRLLQEAIERGGGARFSVISGGCQRPVAQQPYSPLVESLAAYLDARSRVELRRALDGCSWLVHLLPELAETLRAPFPSGTLPSDQERRLLFRAVSRFLSNVAGPAGALLALDDLQWAGADALDLLAFLIRSADTIPLRIVAAYRTNEVDPEHVLSTLLADLSHARLARHLPLDPLSESEAVELFVLALGRTESELSGSERRIVYRTGGVPFFLLSCAEALREGAPDGVPWSVVQSIRQRVAALDDATVDVLETAALVGRVVSHRLLVATSPRSEEEVHRALTIGRWAGLLVEQGKDGCRFAHDVIREVIERDIGTARRAALHRRIAQTLEEIPEADEAAAALAWHFLEGDDPVRALLYALLAGDRAEAAFAHGEAEQQYRTALKLARSVGDIQREREALEKLAAVEAEAARYDEALDLLEQAAHICRMAGDAEAEARVVAKIAEIHRRRGTTREGIARVDSLLASHGDVPSPAVAAAHLARANLLFSASQYGESLEAGERARQIAREVGDEQLLLDAEFRVGTSRGFIGCDDEALAGFEAVACRAETMGSLRTLMAALSNMACIYERKGKLDSSERCWRRHLELAERMDLPERVAWALGHLGRVFFWQGDWPRAADHLDQSLDMLRSLESGRDRAACLQMRGDLYLAAGDRDAARLHLEEAAALAEEGGDLQVALPARWSLAELDLLEGQPDVALARLQPVQDRAQAEGMEPACWSPILARAFLEVGDKARAEEILEKGIAAARRRGDRWYLVDALRALASLAERQDRREKAVCALEEALALARSTPNPYEEARTVYQYAMLHLGRGERRQAEEQLREGLTIFRLLGAGPYVERTERALIELHSS